MKKSISRKTGLVPGTVFFTGDRKVEKVNIHYLEYSPEIFEESELNNHEKIILNNNQTVINWYDVRGIHDTALVENMGKVFDIHPLVLEDLVDVYQRPKFEEYDSGILIILKSLSFHPDKKNIQSEHIGLYFTQGLMISFQEDHTDVFSSVRTRVKVGKGKVRSRLSDYLAYALCDNIVDQYYLVLEQINEEIANLEEDVIQTTDNSIKIKIHDLKKQVMFMRKQIVPLREAISKFSKSDNDIIDERSSIFIRDLYDHTIHILDMVESQRELLNGLQDLFISEISFKMNQVMQVLTVITTIFVPLSFLVGLYGMNFVNIPELQFKNGYFFLLGFMLILVASLLLWFKSKKWF